MIIKRLLDFIYPPKCLFCGKIDEKFICKKCYIKLEKIENAQIIHYNNEKCNFNEHVYLFKYKDIIREKIIAYKFNDKSYYYHAFSNILIKNKKIYEILNSYDIITAVPMHNKRKKIRGYNQAELIARDLSNNICNIKYEDILIKKSNVMPQSLLNREQRIQNAKNIYDLKTNNKNLSSMESKKILLFDDIYTTGSTAMECAKVLKRLKPKRIGIMTIAKD